MNFIECYAKNPLYKIEPVCITCVTTLFRIVEDPSCECVEGYYNFENKMEGIPRPFLGSCEKC